VPASQADDLAAFAAFAAFADLEDAFEPLEALVIQLATDVDHELQLQYDIARGKVTQPGRTILGLERPLVQHVAVDRIQRARLVQIHDSFAPGLRPRPVRVIVMFADPL